MSKSSNRKSVGLLPQSYALPANVAHDKFDQQALHIIDVLQKAGFDAYIVGGGVRDLLIGKAPKDFDVATNAKPEEIRGLFSNCRLIGKRFRLAHIYYRRHIIEVATFRASHKNVKGSHDLVTKEGMVKRDNVFGSLEEDASRRDFTLNALYFDPNTAMIIDYATGFSDIEEGVIRTIGDPVVRFQEDPVRILRAIRFKTKLGFTIDALSEQAIAETHPCLRLVSHSRLFEEYRKLFFNGRAYENFYALHHYEALGHLFPLTVKYLEDDTFSAFVDRALHNTDERVIRALGVNPAFLMACFLWPEFKARYQLKMKTERLPLMTAVHAAAGEVIGEQLKFIGMPKRYSLLIKKMWVLQFALEKRIPKRISRLLLNRHFRAAYDFLLLRVILKEVPASLGQWWTDIQAESETDKTKRINALKRHTYKPRSKKKQHEHKTTKD